MKKSNIKIIVCCHKQDVWKTDDVYMPIQVGKAISDVDLGILGDDTGENISFKNKSYCELTGLYWAWKNLKDIDYIGLCHYRRYFNFHEKGTSYSDSTRVNSKKFDTLDLSLPNIEKIFTQNDILLVKHKVYPVNLFTSYSTAHISDDARIIEDIVIKKHPEYTQSIEDWMHNSNKLSHYNMFVMRWDYFDNYCAWLFPILEEAEKEINITNYNEVQKRIWGYISERLLLLFVHQQKMRVKYFPIYWINEDPEQQSFINRWQRQLRSNLAFNIMKKRTKSK